MTSSCNKRIAKNTIVLYFRMFVSMVVSLYTSRIIFNTLGENNFGLYNVVGSIIIFFTFLNSGLTAATRRYITTEIGKEEKGDLQHVFNIGIQAHLLIAFIIFFLAECIGIYIVNNVLNIPEGRYFAANFVFQASIVIAIIGIFQSPYQSVIIAFEKMSIYAYFSIIDIGLKLAIVYLLQVTSGDKLIIFSILMVAVSSISFGINLVYCNHTFLYCHLKRISDHSLLKDVFKFMSWSLLGQIATVATNQGVSMLVNIYYSVVVNAAMGISSQVTCIVSSFTSNFQTAFNPQIIKLFNNKEFSELKILIIRAAKISSFLILIFFIPICFEIENVLKLWLGDFPKYTPQFVVYTLIAIYIESISAPLYMVMYSQTNIRNYQILISSVYCLCFFIGWIILYFGADPYMVITVRIFIFCILLLIRLWYLKKLVSTFHILQFLYDVLLKGCVICIIVSAITHIAKQMINIGEIGSLICVSAISIIASLSLMYLIGLTSQEKHLVRNLIIEGLSRRSR